MALKDVIAWDSEGKPVWEAFIKEDASPVGEMTCHK